MWGLEGAEWAIGDECPAPAAPSPTFRSFFSAARNE